MFEEAHSRAVLMSGGVTVTRIEQTGRWTRQAGISWTWKVSVGGCAELKEGSVRKRLEEHKVQETSQKSIKHLCWGCARMFLVGHSANYATDCEPRPSSIGSSTTLLLSPPPQFAVEMGRCAGGQATDGTVAIWWSHCLHILLLGSFGASGGPPFS